MDNGQEPAVVPQGVHARDIVAGAAPGLGSGLRGKDELAFVCEAEDMEL